MAAAHAAASAAHLHSASVVQCIVGRALVGGAVASAF